MGVIRFNGISSADFGCTIERRPNHTRGSRRGELIEVPGRNGAAVLEDGSFTTYKQEYVMAFKEGDTMPPYKRAAQVAGWLLGSHGFCRLEDDFEPNVYRMARYAGALNIEQVADKYGQAALEFECQPQRYLKSGEVEIKTNTHNDREGIELSQAPFGAEKIAVRITAPSGTTLSGVTANFYKDGTLHPCTIRKQYETEDKVIFYGERDVVDGAAFFVSVDDNSIFDSVAVLQVVGDESKTIAVIGNSSPVIINPTQFESRPLLKFVDTSEEPPIVPQTLTKNMGTKIAADGGIIKSTWSGDEYLYTSDPLPVSGGGVAIITGISYAFYDSNDKAIKVYRATPYDARTLLKSERVLIPSGAATVIVGGEDSGGGQYDTTEAELSLQAARPNPGASAVTINGTTISLDFSVHDTIYLDCDLHDAHYIDGSSANDKVTFTSNIDPYPTFPGFAPGENTVIVRDGDNLDFSIVPRWWTL